MILRNYKEDWTFCVFLMVPIFIILLHKHTAKMLLHSAHFRKTRPECWSYNDIRYMYATIFFGVPWITCAEKNCYEHVPNFANWVGPADAISCLLVTQNEQQIFKSNTHSYPCWCKIKSTPTLYLGHLAENAKTREQHSNSNNLVMWSTVEVLRFSWKRFAGWAEPLKLSSLFSSSFFFTFGKYFLFV